MNLPRHIAIIPDGNRRWAKQKSLPVFLGHHEGGKTAEKIIQAVFNNKIPYLTIWGASLNNVTKRSKTELKFLYEVFELSFQKLASSKEIHSQKVRVRVLGRWQEFFPAKLQRTINSLIKETENYRDCNLTFLMAYNGTDEMAEAIRQIANVKPQSSELKIDEKFIKSNLWTRDLPAVDLVIRTGGEAHLSAGFMMWDIAEARFYFSETLWPAFTKKELENSLEEYSAGEKRLGK